MCVPNEISEAEFSRRGLLGLGGAGLAAAATGTLLTSAEAQAVPNGDAATASAAVAPPPHQSSGASRCCRRAAS